MGKYFYRIYGLTLVSDYEFPQFVSIDAVEDADIEIEYGKITDTIMDKAKQGIEYETGDKELWFCNKIGIFWIHDNKISFKECDNSNIDDAALYLPGMCLSILLWYRKMVMIHGACLRYKGKTIIVAGNSGAGKSTVTTELIKRGALLMADDVTGIGYDNGKYISYPAFPAQKLCEDQVDNNAIDKTGLKRIKYDLNKFEIMRNDKFYDEPCTVDMLFVMEKGDVEDLYTCEITGANKLRVVKDAIFIDWLFDDEFKIEPEDVFRCVGIANQIRIFGLRRNKEKDTLGKILDFIDSKMTSEDI